MSEVDARPPASRGRSSHRGGRGGFNRGSARGGRKAVNGSTRDDSLPTEDGFDDQGELGEMKKKYSSELVMLKDMFPDWTDVDLVFALRDNDGDIPSTVDHITQGSVSQFAEVKSAKDRARSKAKEATPTTTVGDKQASRGGRGRGGFESTRGGRSRGADRGRGGSRAGRGGHATTEATAKSTTAASIPTTESTAWDAGTATAAAGNEGAIATEVAKDAGDAGQSTWGNVVTSDATPAAASEGMKSALIPEGGPKKSWASMFAPKPAPAPPKPPQVAQNAPAELVAAGHIPAANAAVEEVKAAEQAQTESAIPSAPESEHPTEPEATITEPAGEELEITPSNVPLTEENVEHLPDVSHPPATHTVVSNAGSIDPRNLTPLPAIPAGRPPLGGYAASAYRATGAGMRSASFQRRVQEQQEAVVMPGHNAVDRAAVQFGSMGLNGEPGLDVDEDREEPETRQAPQHSPPSQPRTSLPPVPRQASATHELPEAVPTTKQAPGLPPAHHQNQPQMQEANLNNGLQNDHAQMNQQYQQYGRYGQPGMQQESMPQQQKAYDPFSHQAQPSQYDQYGMQSQQMPQHQQHQGHAGFGGLPSAPNDAQQYAADQRNAYQQYYGSSFGAQEMRGQSQQTQSHESGIAQQRSASGFGAGPNESAYPTQAQQQVQSRFNEAPGSGNNTPNPVMGQHQQQSGANTANQQQTMHQAPSHQQQASYAAAQAGFPYGHPYYTSPYQQAYNNQFGFSHQLGYGGGYPGKQSMYGGSHGYGMAPQSSYEQHSSTPSNTGSFNPGQQSSMRSASGMSGLAGGLDEYGRSSAQSHQQSSGFGGVNDPFARSASGFGTQGSYGQQSISGQDDSLKTMNENKTAQSPALGQPGRPESAASNQGNSAQSGLPPPQSQQSGFGGGYGGFPGQNQYNPLGGLGAQSHGQNNMSGQQGYGGYGAGGSFGQTYGSYSNRGGWGSNYGTH